MRNIQKLIVFTLLTSLFSCNNDDILKDVINTEKKENFTLQKSGNFQNNSQNNVLQYSQSGLIIQYKFGTTIAAKNSLRQIHGVVSFEVCKHCPDESIERWNFGGQIDIEPKKGVIKNPDDGPPPGLYPIINVDYDFFHHFSLSNSSFSSVFETEYDSFIKATNEGVTIAVIDTGIDTSLPVFTEPFLYDASEDDLAGVLSGWDFVNNDNDPYDDDSGKHGTAIIKIINDELRFKGIKHQIIPIKAFNSAGSGTYFDVLCSVSHAMTYANIINMSFGWYDDDFGDFENTIFSNLLTTHPNVIVIASAGNNGTNNDGDKHYPSGYSQDNLFSIAATNQYYTDIASYSNYGINSVDYFASGYATLLDSELYGTSFAAPIATSFIASIFGIETPSPEFIITSINLMSPFVDFDEPYHVKYNRIIIP